MRSRRWTFTHYPTPAVDDDGEVDDFAEVDFGVADSLPPGASYYLAGFEVCPRTGRPHIQGYVEWKNGKTLSATRTALGLPAPHLEAARGTAAQNQTYCKKEGDFAEFGEASRQGARTDLDEVRLALDNGASLKEISETHFSDFVRYERGFRSYTRLHSVQRDWEMEVIVLLGPSGTGKTKHCADNYPGAYWKMDGKWWDGYEGQETVIVDEMYGHRFPYTVLLRLLDRYPYAVEVKGGTIEFTSRRIVFTSNQEPEHWYSQEATHQMDWAENPLKRRLDQFAKIIYTGEVHRARPRPVIVDPNEPGVNPNFV